MDLAGHARRGASTTVLVLGGLTTRTRSGAAQRPHEGPGGDEEGSRLQPGPTGPQIPRRRRRGPPGDGVRENPGTGGFSQARDWGGGLRRPQQDRPTWSRPQDDGTPCPKESGESIQLPRSDGGNGVRETGGRPHDREPGFGRRRRTGPGSFGDPTRRLHEEERRARGETPAAGTWSTGWGGGEDQSKP